MGSSPRVPLSGSSPHDPIAGASPLIARRTGFTLVELLVTLLILSLAVGMVGLSVSALELRPESEVPRRLAAARSQAIRGGAAATVEFEGGVRVAFYPDGSATPARIADGEVVWWLEPWTGEVRRD